MYKIDMKILENKTLSATLLAFLAALLYGLSAPLSKLLLNHISPTFLAGLLYLGAGSGMFIITFISQINKQTKEENLEKSDLPYVIGMVVLDILAPILLMFSLTQTTAETVSLLNNFEIVVTSFIAFTLFKEKISKKLWLAISIITIASIVLSVENLESLKFSSGAFLAIGATISWGLENNFTRKLSIKNPLHIVVIKGFGAGFGSIVIAFFVHESIPGLNFMFYALILGFFAFGLSIYFYISAQRHLGAARTSSYYAVAPFMGVIMSWIFLHESLTLSFFIALMLMIVGTYLVILESK